MDQEGKPILLDYSVENTPRKRYLQKRLRELVGKWFRSNVLGLAGPNILTYFSVWRDLLTGADAKLTSYEFDAVTYHLQNSRVSKANLKPIDKKRIALNYGNIKVAKPERFIDLDLIQGWEASESLISTLFKKQYTMPPEYKLSKKGTVRTKLKRVFNVTVTTRGAGGLQTAMQHLNDLLNTEIGILDSTPVKDHLGRELGTYYNLNGNSKEFTVNLFTYADRATMANFLIQY